MTLEYDTIGRTKYHPDSVVLDLIEAVVAARATSTASCSGLDLGARDYLRAYDGGPGMRYLMTDVRAAPPRAGSATRPSTGSSSPTRRGCTRSPGAGAAA